MTNFQPNRAASPRDVVSAVQIDPKTRVYTPLTEEQIAIAAAAAWPLFDLMG